MSEARNRLIASRNAASAAKDAFESLYLADRHDLAVGLGVNQDGDSWTVQVFARTPAAAKALPDHFNEFPVEVTVTGDVKTR